MSYITTSVVSDRYAPPPQGPRSDHAFLGRRRVHDAQGEAVDVSLDDLSLLARSTLTDAVVFGVVGAESGRGGFGGDAFPDGPIEGVRSLRQLSGVARGRDSEHGGGGWRHAGCDRRGERGRRVRYAAMGDRRPSRTARSGDGSEWTGAYQHRRDHCGSGFTLETVWFSMGIGASPQRRG